MAQYRKKPVVIEAYNIFGTEEPPLWMHEAFKNGTVDVARNGAFEVKTLEGTMRGAPRDWIIRGVQGELYPCRADIFEATYEAVESEEPQAPHRELEVCPFCGVEATAHAPDYQDHHWFIGCYNPECPVKPRIKALEYRHARADWNTRA